MTREHTISRLLPILVLVSFFMPAISLADPPQIPSGSGAGSQASRFQTETQLEKNKFEKKKPKAPEIEMQKEEEKKPSAEAGPAFILKDVKVTGSTLFKAEHFRPIYEPYIGKKVSLQDIQTIADNIKAEYKKRGYLTTTVYVPEQEVAGGDVEIKILEGTVGDISLEGNKWFSKRLITNYFHTKKNDILNVYTLAKDLLRLSQNSDLEVKAVIAAGKEPGSSDIILTVKDKLPYHAGAAFDNQGSRLVGKYRTSISFRSTNLTGQGDSAYFNTLESAFSQGNFMSYYYPIDTYGTKVGLDVITFDTKLGRELKGFDITGNTQIYIPRISAEMALSENFQASADTGIEIKTIKQWIQGNKISDDELRTPFITLNFSEIDSWFGGGQTSLMTKFSFGTSGFLGASVHDHTGASRHGTGGFFFKYEQTLQRIQRMPFDSYISSRVQFQNATDTLPSSEQMQFGGANYTRGYPEGDFIADYGVNMNNDWVFPLPFVPKDFKLPYSETPLRHQIEPVAFMDLGGGKLKKVNPGEKSRKFLMGLGGGLRIQINRNLYIRLEWAERTGDRPSIGNAPSNFHIVVQGEI